MLRRCPARRRPTSAGSSTARPSPPTRSWSTAARRLGILTTAGFEDILIIGRTKRSRDVRPLHGPRRAAVPGPRRQHPRHPRAARRRRRRWSSRSTRRRSCARGASWSSASGVDADGRLLPVRLPEPRARAPHARADPAARYPGLPVSLSSEVDPRYREYERLVLTGFDAYVRPVIRRYLAGSRGELDGRAGIHAPLQIMQSRGGDQRRVERRASGRSGTILSGPAAGRHRRDPRGAAGRLRGLPSAIDVGGTSCDVALCEGGQPVVSTDGHIERYPAPDPDDRRPHHRGRRGQHRLGRRGRRAQGRAAERRRAARAGRATGAAALEPTVTDASVVLGYLNPESFAGGTMPLRPDLARRAVEAHVAAPLGLDVAAGRGLGIHRIVNANMAQTLRVVSVEAGPRSRDSSAWSPSAGPGRSTPAGWPRSSASGPSWSRRRPGCSRRSACCSPNVEHEQSRTLRGRRRPARSGRGQPRRWPSSTPCAPSGWPTTGAGRRPGDPLRRDALRRPVVRAGGGAAAGAGHAGRRWRGPPSSFHEAHRERCTPTRWRTRAVELVTLRAVHAAQPPSRLALGQAGAGRRAAAGRADHRRGTSASTRSAATCDARSTGARRWPGTGDRRAGHRRAAGHDDGGLPGPPLRWSTRLGNLVVAVAVRVGAAAREATMSG